MGVYSTVDVTKEYALKKIYERLETADNDKLADILFHIHGVDVLHNYFVWDNQEDIDIHCKNKKY